MNSYFVEGMTWKNTGFFSGIKRLIAAAIEIEDNGGGNIYFSLKSKNYCKGQTNCFNILFDQHKDPPTEYIQKNSKIVPYLNSGI